MRNKKKHPQQSFDQTGVRSSGVRITYGSGLRRVYTPMTTLPAHTTPLSTSPLSTSPVHRHPCPQPHPHIPMSSQPPVHTPTSTCPCPHPLCPHSPSAQVHLGYTPHLPRYMLGYTPCGQNDWQTHVKHYLRFAVGKYPTNFHPSREHIQLRVIERNMPVTPKPMKR